LSDEKEKMEVISSPISTADVDHLAERVFQECINMLPLGKEELKTRLKGTTIKGVPAEEIIEKMKFPVKSPAEVLRQIRELTE